MKLDNALTVALDPGRILQACGITPDPWQRDLLMGRHRHILLNCSRQTGKSTAVAALAVHTALFQPGSLTLLLSPSLRQSAELFRKTIDCFNALGRPLRAIGDSHTQLELANRSRIVCLPGQEETIRSFSGVALLVIDEAARVSDDLYRSVRPMLAVSQGRLVCLSTPFGKRGFFFREWTTGGPYWHRVRMPWQQCPRIAQEHIDRELTALGESWVRQEYECSFEALEGVVYPEFEERCAVDRLPDLMGKRVGGIDFGWNNPFAAVWGVLDRDDVLWLVGERYLRETPIHEHATALCRHVMWYADPSGPTEIAELRRASVPVRKGRNEIRPGIAAVNARIRTARLRVHRSACPNLLAEAKLYHYERTPEGTHGEEPIDADNHALAALRYLVATIDIGVVARLRKMLTSEPGKPDAPNIKPPQRKWNRYDNPAVWTRIA